MWNRLTMWTCRTFGHRRVYHAVRRMRRCRDGIMRMRDCTRVSCKRCGLGGDWCYEPGTVERLLEWWREQLNEIRAVWEYPTDAQCRGDVDDCPF